MEALLVVASNVAFQTRQGWGGAEEEVGGSFQTVPRWRVALFAHGRAVRSRRRPQDDQAQRAVRALALVRMEDCRVLARHWKGHHWHGALATLGILTDPKRRPRVPRVQLSEEVQHAAPARLFELDAEEFLTNLRKARRGAAPGPSGMTSDRLFPVL